MDNRVRALIVLAVTLVVGMLGGSIVWDENEPASPTETKAIVPEAVVVDGADQDAKPDDIIEQGPAAREVTESLLEHGSDVEADTSTELRGTDEAGPVAVLQPPFAAEEVPGCRSAFLTTNWSARVAQPIWFGLHFTAGYDKPGSRAEVDGLTAFGNNPASRVSWHFNEDKDGNCDYNVPLRYKAWTIGNANSYTINIEVAGRGEAPYLRPAGYRQLARIWKYVHEAYPNIPLAVGSMSNCGPGRPGWITHWMGGPCSGGHTDIKPHELAQVVANVREALQELRCGDRCEALKKRHAAAHRRYRERDCRATMHKRKLSELRRPECRRVKKLGHEQHRKLRERYGVRS